jgi:predicted secreted protein
MSWVTGLAIYFIVWWVVLFTVLPWGVRPPENPEPGTAPSAPENPRLWLKAGITTAIAGLVWLAIYALVESDLISLRDAVAA